MATHWLTASAPRRSRAAYTVVGSVALHGSIIAVAALWPVRDAPPAPPPLVTDIDTFAPEASVALPPSPAEADLTPPDATEAPQPEAAEVSTDVPPSPEEPLMTQPAPPRPPSKTVVSKTRSLHPVLPVAVGAGSVTNPARVSMVGKWHTPQPPYPFAMRAARVQGSGSVRITTDGTGRVVEASVVRSTGNALLDENTSQFARANWNGPASATVTVPITYQMR